MQILTQAIWRKAETAALTSSQVQPVLVPRYTGVAWLTHPGAVPGLNYLHWEVLSLGLKVL